MMHRYWDSTFPEDSNKEINKEDLFNSMSIYKAMDITDKHIGTIIDFCDKNSSDLLLLSAMGQDHIDWGEYKSEIFLFNSVKLLRKLGLPIKDYQLFPAMQPDIVFDCSTKTALKNLIKLVTNLEDKDGNNLIKLRYKPVGLRVNFSLGRETNSLLKSKKIFNPTTNVLSNIEDYGLKLFQEIKAQHHIPEGILLAYGINSQKFSFEDNQEINICDIKLKILEIFNVL